MAPTFCTLADPAGLASARVLAEGLAAAHPGCRILVSLLRGATPALNEPFESVAPATPPELLHRLLDDGSDPVVFIDARTAIYAELTPVLETARLRGVAVLARAENVPEDGHAPGPAALRRAGPVSDRMIAVVPGAAAVQLLDRWNETPGNEWPGDVFPSDAVVRDPGSGVSAWNLHERPLTREGGVVLAGGSPLRSVDFDGFRADRPYWLSENADRVLVVEDPILSEMCGEHGERLRAAGWTAPVAHLGGLQRLGNAHRVDHLVRSLWQDGGGFGDPLRTADADAFVAWLREPARVGAASGVNRYLYAAYLTRPDLQDAFPDLDGADGARFMGWAWEHGRREVLPELLPASDTDGGLADDYRLGVNVVGYLNDTLGLAEAARLYVDGLAAAGIPVTTTAIRPDMALGPGETPVRHRSGHLDYRDRRSAVAPAFNLVCANGDQLEAFVRDGGADVLAGRPTIGQWGWETDVLPQSWLTSFRHLDEIWVYTSFVAENLARLSPVPVVVVPMAITVPDVTGVVVDMLDDDRFTFLFMLDFFSTLRRKNAVGLIRAFTRAFEPGEGPRLLIKTINAVQRPAAAEELRYEARNRPDVDLVDGYLEPLEKSALLAGVDCFVSLHRSEGFGLPLAESMALGTPVIATGYSGNLDFMTPHNSWLVDSVPSRVGPDSEIYPPHGTWAEPDLDHAAALMRHVRASPGEALAKAGRARADIDRLYSPRAAGTIARARLERLIDARGSADRGAGVHGSFAEVEHQLALDVRLGASPVPGGLEGRVRRAVLRLMTPFTYHERQLDHAMYDAVRALRSELDRERRERRSDHSRIAALEQAMRTQPERQ